MPEQPTITEESYVDVLVVGAGPAGLFAANGLQKNGVNVRVIDKRPTGIEAGHADGLAARTMEVLQSYGLLEPIMKAGREVHVAAFYEPGPNGIERVRRAPTHTTPTPVRWQGVTLSQAAIEKTLVSSVRSLGLEVERPVVPTSIELSQDKALLDDPQAYPIKVELSHLDATDFHEVRSETVHAKFVIGADGASSWVRKAMDITLDGESTQYVWGVMDIFPSTDFPDIRSLTSVHSNNGSVLIIPREGDLIRLYVQIEENEDLLDEDGRMRDRSLVTPERLLDLAKKSLSPYKIDMVGEPVWHAAYIISQRVAAKFSVDERVFIVGDACHTHSPKAGQGMNASMNDSHNLLWKLTHALRGWSKMPLLRTYEHERRKFAQDLIAFDKKWSSMFSTKTDASTDAPLSTKLAEAWEEFGGFASGVGIHYAPSAITDDSHQSLAASLIVGQRVPPQILVRTADAHPEHIHDLLPADGRFKLLVFAGDIRDPERLAQLRTFAEDIEKKGAFGKEVAGGEREKWLDVVTVSKTPVLDASYTDVPASLRSHWSKVFIDSQDVLNRVGGKAYETYGIGAEGAAVLIRPDGYVGTVAPLNEPGVLDGYFRGAGLMA